MAAGIVAPPTSTRVRRPPPLPPASLPTAPFLHLLRRASLLLGNSDVPSESAVNLKNSQVESCVFPPAINPPGSTKTFFLGGAGVRGMEIEGRFIKFTAIGVYLEDNAVQSLAVKWNGKTADELTDSLDFFGDIVTDAFEKFTNVTTILPLTGKQYSEKVAENCAESAAIEKFLQVFSDENFPPGSSILFTQSPEGSLTMIRSLSAVIENKQLLEAVLESIIGRHGVSPSAKQSLAARISDLQLKPNEPEKVAAATAKPQEN
ncbi:hypothetical protein ABFS83_12G061300 [Erythranthe nasuta]